METFRRIQLTPTLEMLQPGSHQLHDSNVLVNVVSPTEEIVFHVAGTAVMQVSHGSDFVTTGMNTTVTSRTSRKRKVVASIVGWMVALLALTPFIVLASGLADARVVLTGSMAPAIKPGDVVVAVSPQRKAPKIGDVVVYTGRRFDGTKVADFSHRIIAGDAKSGFTVKGDHNSTPDVQKPTIKDISGVVLFTIPFVGRILNPQALLLLLILGFGIWLIVDAFREE